MKFRIASTRIEGFKTFLERTTIDFDALGAGLHYLKGENQEEPSLGSNGAGKSSIWDAICWCLTGTTTDGLRGPDVRPWDGWEGPTKVVTTLFMDDKRHIVRREHTPNILKLDGKECAQETLDRLIGQSLEFITHTTIMGQGQKLFFNKTAREKMDLFSEVLDLDRWERRSAFAAKKVVERQALVYEVVTAIEADEQQLGMLKDLIKPLKEKSDKWQEQRTANQEAIERAIAAATREQEANQKRLDEANLAADGAGTQAKLLLKETDDRRADLASARHFYNKAELRLEASRIEYQSLRRELADLNEDSSCPTCGQSIKGTALAKHVRFIKEQMAKIKAVIDKGIPAVSTEKVTVAQKKLDTTIAHRNKFLEQEEEARATINRCAPLDARYKTTIEMYRKQIAELDEGSNPHRHELQELRKRREKIGEAIADRQRRVKSLEAIIARTKFWVKGFKDIRLLVVEDVLKQLGRTTNTILQEVGLHGWRIEYAIDRETKSGKVRDGLQVMILSPKNEKAVKWECWSGGEGQRLLIVGALALSKVLLDYVGIETNLEVLDEPTQYIGEEGIEDIIELLAERARRLNRTIIYTDHAARESALFSSTILVTKSSDGSRVHLI